MAFANRAGKTEGELTVLHSRWSESLRVSRYDPDAPETLAGYGELITFADLRGVLEYESEYVDAAGEFASAKVRAGSGCAVRAGWCLQPRIALNWTSTAR